MITEENVMMQPRNGLVLITRETIAETEQGIILPSGSSVGEFDVARIVAIGPGTPAENGGRIADVADLEVGMRVVIKSANVRTSPSRIPGAVSRESRPSTLPFKINGEETELIHQADILTILGETNDSD